MGAGMNSEPARRGLLTLTLVAVYVLLQRVPPPGIDLALAQESIRGDASLGQRAAFAVPGLLTLGVYPYLIASGVVTTWVSAQRRAAGDDEPRFPFATATLAITVIVALIQAWAESFRWTAAFAGSDDGTPGAAGLAVRVGFALTLVAGALLAVAMAHAISRRGIGNGLCLLYGVALLDRLLGWPLTDDGRLVPLFSERGILLGLALAGALVFLIALMGARWRPHGLDRDALHRLAGGPQLGVVGVGIAGVAVATAMMAMPATLALLVLPVGEGPAAALALSRPGPVHALVFVLLATFISALLTAWAFDPAGIVALLRRWYGDSGAPDSPIAAEAYDRGVERLMLPAACALAVAAYLFWAAVERVGATWFSVVAIAVVTAVVLDTARQWGVHVEADGRARQRGGVAACDRCGAAIDEAMDFCPACGAGFAAGRQCPLHPDRAVLAACVVCGAELCEACGTDGRRPTLCAAHRDTDFIEGWAVVAVCSTGLEAAFLRDRLAKHDVEALVLENTCAPVYGAPGLFDINPLMPVIAHRECGGGAIRLLVRPGCLEAASAVIEPHPRRPGDAGRV